MSAAAVQAVSEQRVFQPRTKFAYLPSDHVPFDELTGRAAYETRVLRTILSGPVSAAVIGPVGAGKSSIIATVCQRLPETHVALRVPVVGVDDPTNTSAIAAMALSTAISAVELEAYQREALEHHRADQITAARQPTAVGGKLGGGAFPGEVHLELGTLSQQLATNHLAGERLAELDRLVSILVARDRQPVFVLEDTEAAVGGRDDHEAIDGFFNGPVTAFVREVDAVCLIAVQDPIAEHPAFRRLAPTLDCVRLPSFDEDDAPRVLRTIFDHRLKLYGLDLLVEDILDDGAVNKLAEYYRETGDLRHALAAAQTAADHAAETGGERVGVGHGRAAISDWRPR